MKNLILVINGKGGVGKSFVAVNLIQFLKDQKVPHRGFDTDNENSTLKRFHPEAEFVDIGNGRELDRILSALDNHSLVVADCRAASTDLFLDYFKEIGLPEVLGVIGAHLTLVIPINHEPDSLDQVQRLADQMETTARYLIVRNASHSDSFALFDASKIKRRLSGPLKAREISMTRLQDWLVEALNKENVTATTAKTHPAFSLLDRQRLQHWQRGLYSQFDSNKDILLPTP